MRRVRSLAEARWLADLSEPQAVALRRYGDGTVTDCDGPAGAGIGASTDAALVRAGLVEVGVNAKGDRVWRPTDRGWAVLRTAEPRLLAARSDALYVTELADAWSGGDGDPGEGVDEQTLEDFASGAATADGLRRDRVAEQVAAERAALQAKLMALKHLARVEGVEVRSDLRVIEARVAELDAAVGVERPVVPKRAA